MNPPDTVTLDLRDGVEGLAETRRSIATALHERAVDAARVEAVAIAATELLTNALVHAASNPRLTLTVRRDCVLLRVCDRSSEAPAPRAGRSPDGHGLGLRMVDADRKSTRLNSSH